MISFFSTGKLQVDECQMFLSIPGLSPEPYAAVFNSILACPPGCLRGISDLRDARQSSCPICLLHHTLPKLRCPSLPTALQLRNGSLHPLFCPSQNVSEVTFTLPVSIPFRLYFTSLQIFLNLSTTNCYHSGPVVLNRVQFWCPHPLIPG